MYILIFPTKKYREIKLISFGLDVSQTFPSLYGNTCISKGDNSSVVELWWLKPAALNGSLSRSL